MLHCLYYVYAYCVKVYVYTYMFICNIVYICTSIVCSGTFCFGYCLSYHSYYAGYMDFLLHRVGSYWTLFIPISMYEMYILCLMKQRATQAQISSSPTPARSPPRITSPKQLVIDASLLDAPAVDIVISGLTNSAA